MLPKKLWNEMQVLDIGSIPLQSGNLRRTCKGRKRWFCPYYSETFRLLPFLIGSSIGSYLRNSEMEVEIPPSALPINREEHRIEYSIKYTVLLGGPPAWVTLFIFPKDKTLDISYIIFLCKQNTVCLILSPVGPLSPFSQKRGLHPGTTKTVRQCYLALNWKEICYSHIKESLSSGELNS